MDSNTLSEEENTRLSVALLSLDGHSDKPTYRVTGSLVSEAPNYRFTCGPHLAALVDAYVDPHHDFDDDDISMEAAIQKMDIALDRMTKMIADDEHINTMTYFAMKNNVDIVRQQVNKLKHMKVSIGSRGSDDFKLTMQVYGSTGNVHWTVDTMCT